MSYLTALGSTLGSLNNSVDVLGQEDHIGVDLRRPQDRSCVRGEEGVPGPAAEDDHAALLQVADGLGADIASAMARISMAVCTRTGIPFCSHTSATARQFITVPAFPCGRPGCAPCAAAVFRTAPEVAAAHHQTYLDAHVQTLLDDIADLTNHLKIQAGMLVTGQGLAADLQQDPFIHSFAMMKTSVCSAHKISLIF